MMGNRTLDLIADLVQTTVRPVKEERPAFDLLRYKERVGEVRAYQRDVNRHRFREALDVTTDLDKNKIKLLELIQS